MAVTNPFADHHLLAEDLVFTTLVVSKRSVGLARMEQIEERIGRKVRAVQCWGCEAGGGDSCLVIYLIHRPVSCSRALPCMWLVPISFVNRGVENERVCSPCRVAGLNVQKYCPTTACVT